MALPHGLAAKLGKPIRLLMSDSQGEALAALCAIARLLETHGRTFHDLADHVENANGGSLSEDDKKKIRSEIENAHALGYAEGVKAAEARQHGTGAFRNTDGALEWTEVALYCQREKQWLPSKITSSSMIWHHAPFTGASQLQDSISICTACSSNSEARSHERSVASRYVTHRPRGRTLPAARKASPS